MAQPALFGRSGVRSRHSCADGEIFHDNSYAPLAYFTQFNTSNSEAIFGGSIRVYTYNLRQDGGDVQNCVKKLGNRPLIGTYLRQF